MTIRATQVLSIHRRCGHVEHVDVHLPVDPWLVWALRQERCARCAAVWLARWYSDSVRRWGQADLARAGPFAPLYVALRGRDCWEWADRVGGQFGTGMFGTGCRVFYRAPDHQRYPYEVSFDRDGNVVPAPCAAQAVQDCGKATLDPATAQAGCQSGRAHLRPGTWHADTAICSL